MVAGTVPGIELGPVACKASVLIPVPWLWLLWGLGLEHKDALAQPTAAPLPFTSLDFPFSCQSLDGWPEGLWVERLPTEHLFDKHGMERCRLPYSVLQSSKVRNPFCQDLTLTSTVGARLISPRDSGTVWLAERVRCAVLPDKLRGGCGQDCFPCVSDGMCF